MIGTVPVTITVNYRKEQKMEKEAIKTRYIERYDGGIGVILKIFEKSGMYGFTVQDSDGPNGLADTLTPFLTSEYIYESEDEAEAAAEEAIATCFNPDEEMVETVEEGEYRSFHFKIRECGCLKAYYVDLGEDIEPLSSNFEYWSIEDARNAAMEEIDCYARN